MTLNSTPAAPTKQLTASELAQKLLDLERRKEEEPPPALSLVRKTKHTSYGDFEDFDVFIDGVLVSDYEMICLTLRRNEKPHLSVERTLNRKN